MGIPPGPERAQLVRGNAVTLKDGRTIQPDEVLGPDLPGARYVHIGDVGRTDNIVQYVQDAHALVMEATYLNEDAEMARQFGHMTAAQAARLAVEANVKTLILTHISRRSRERERARSLGHRHQADHGRSCAKRRGRFDEATSPYLQSCLAVG